MKGKSTDDYLEGLRSIEVGIADAADILGITRRRMREMLDGGEIRGRRYRHANGAVSWRVKLREIDRVLDAMNAEMEASE